MSAADHQSTTGSGKGHSASGATAYRKLTKADRHAIGQRNAPAVVGKPANGGLRDAFKGPQSIFNAPPSPLASMPREVNPGTGVKRQDGPVCAFCGQRRDLQPFQQPTGELVPACPICAKLRARPVRLALPAPRAYAYWRPVRRELVRMTAGKPRQIPSGPVFALGPGDKPSPYDPPAIERWYNTLIREMGQAIELRAIVLTSSYSGKGERGTHHPVWEADCAVQRMQHAALMYGNLLKAA